MRTKLTVTTAFIFLSFLSCKKDNNNSTNNNSNTNTNTSSYHIQATLDGLSLAVNHNATGYGYSSGMGGPESGSDDNTMCSYTKGSLFMNPFDSSVPEYFIAVTKLLYNFDEFGDCYSLTQAQYESILYVGNFSYSSESDESGAVNQITDNGTSWNTSKGSQAGSTFEITSYVDDATGAASKIVTFKFDCKLYDGDGNSKTFVGEWVGRY